MNNAEQLLARNRLEHAYQQIPALLAGPDTPTPEYEEWTATVSRGLRLGFPGFLVFDALNEIEAGVQMLPY